MKSSFLALSLLLAAGIAVAAPATYTIEPHHTYPSFEADHMGGMSVWRGKFRTSSGIVKLDTAEHSGEVGITIDVGSIDFGYDKLNEHAKSADMFDVAKYPTATYRGRFTKFTGDVPAEVDGELTLHGVTKPVTLIINSFKCNMHPILKKQFCGADASASLNRDDFGVPYGKDYGFSMVVKLAIQVEAIKAD